MSQQNEGFTKQEILEFKKIFEKSYKRKITYKQAHKQLIWMYDLHKVLYEIVYRRTKMQLNNENQKKDESGNTLNGV